MSHNLNIKKAPNQDAKTVALRWNTLLQDLEEMKLHGYKNIAINSAWGWVEGKPIDFIYDNDWIEGVEIVEDDCNISAINKLSNLKYLHISTDKVTGCIDFLNLPLLNALTIWWQKKVFNNLSSCSNLAYLVISRFLEQNLDWFSKNNKLKHLGLNYSRLKSLDGIQDFRDLKIVDIYSAPHLTTLNFSPSVVKSIHRLALEKCKKISDYKIIEKMVELESLYLFESAPIHSVNFLRNMKNLRYAYIGVDIIDGNVSFLKERGFEFKNARLYK